METKVEMHIPTSLGELFRKSRKLRSLFGDTSVKSADKIEGMLVVSERKIEWYPLDEYNKIFNSNP